MKIYDLNLGRVAVVSLSVLLVCLPQVLLGGQLVAPEAVTAAKAAGYDLEIKDGQLIRPTGKVDATLANVVDALRDRYTDANIVVSPELAKLKIADLKLRAGRLAEELEAVRIASGEKFEVQGPSGPNPPMDPNTGLPLAGAINLDRGLFVLRETRPQPEKQRVVEAFNIGPYLEWLRRQPRDQGQTVDPTDKAMQEITTILDDTLSRLEGDSPNIDHPSWQYHRGATLLVLIGRHDSIEVARKIINALPGMTSMAEDSRAPSGWSESGGPPDRVAKQRAAADDAFRARYGLKRSNPSSPQPVPAEPESSPPK